MALKKMTPQRRKDLLSAVKEDEAILDAEYVPAWDDYEMLYTGRYKGKPIRYSGDDNVYLLNVAIGAVESLTASSTVSGLRHTFSPRSKEKTLNAMVHEAFVAQQVASMQAETTFNDASRMAKKFGSAWVRLDWRFDSPTDDLHVSPTAKEVAEVLASRDRLTELFPENPPGAIPSDREVSKALKGTKIQTRSGPKLTAYHPDQILMDSSRRKQSDVRWVGERKWVPIDSVHNDPALREKPRKKVHSMATSVKADSQTVLQNHGGFLSESFRLCKIYDIWDYDTHKRIMWAEGVDEPLLEEDWPYHMGTPFRKIACFGGDMIRGPGAIEILVPSLKQRNEIRNSLRSARGRIEREVFLIDERMKDTENIIPFLRDAEPGASIFVDTRNGAIRLSDMVYRLQPSEVNPEIYRQDALSGTDAEMALGVDELRQGLPVQGTHRTAQEIALMSQFGQARIQQMIDSARFAWLDMGRMLAMLNQQFMTDGEVARLRGYGRTLQDMAQLQEEKDELAQQLEASGSFIIGPDLVYPFNREELEIDFDFDIQTEVAPPQTQVLRAQTAMTMLQTLLPFPEVDRRKLIRNALKFGFGSDLGFEDFLLPQGQQAAPVTPSGAVAGSEPTPGGTPAAPMV